MMEELFAMVTAVGQKAEAAVRKERRTLRPE